MFVQKDTTSEYADRGDLVIPPTCEGRGIFVEFVYATFEVVVFIEKRDGLAVGLGFGAADLGDGAEVDACIERKSVDIGKVRV